MRTQYHFWPAGTGPDFDAWNVARLIELSRGFPVIEVPVAGIAEVDTDYWTDAGSEPTVRRVLGHARMILAVDPAYPIILGPDDRLMDGMHRVCRAVLEDRPTVPAVRFEVLPEPDARNVRLTDLP